MTSCFVSSSRIYQKEAKRDFYLVIDKEVYQKYNEEFSGRIELEVDSDSLVISKVSPDEMGHFSHFVHERFNRCGSHSGFFSLEEAITELESVENVDQVQSLLIETDIDQPVLVEAATDLINLGRIQKTIEELSSFYTRYSRSNTGVDSSEWILREWRNITKSRADAEVSFFHHSWSQPSVYAKIKGVSDDIIVIGGHLDSKNYNSSTTGLAPGADDDASGIAVITEVIRVLVDSNYVPDNTLVFVGYSAEEDGLLGSKDFVKYTFNTNVNILGVLQIDMALHNKENDQIYIMQDFSNPGQNTFVANLINTYTGTTANTDFDCGYGCSDHAAWNHPSLGYLGTMPFEAEPNFGAPNPKYQSLIHTTQDVLGDLNNSLTRAVDFAKLGAAFMIEVDQ